MSDQNGFFLADQFHPDPSPLAECISSATWDRSVS
jgi:hypothetical protein